MPSEWLNPLQQLYSYLTRNDEKFDLLQEIDRKGPDISVPLEATISSAAARLAKMTGADAAYTYAFDGIYFHCTSGNDQGIAPPRISSKQLFDGQSSDRWALKVLPKAKLAVEQNQLLPSTSVVAAVPLFAPPDSCFGLILLSSSHPIEFNVLSDPETQTFIESVGQQLSNAIFLRDVTQRAQLQANLTLAFFQKALDPTDCFNELANQVPNFLPNVGRLASRAEVQILIYDETERVLKIVGSTGNEMPGTRISLENSFCGKLVLDPAKQFRVGDPRADPEYRDYLGKEQNKIMRHELAVLIMWNGILVGVLNLESEMEEAFAPVQIRAMQDLCSPGGRPSIAPLVYALKESVLLADAQEMAVVSALDKHLQTVSGVLKHGTATTASTIGTNLTTLEREMTAIGSDLAKNAKTARLEFGRLVDYIQTFREDIRGFLSFDARSIKGIIEKAINMNSPDDLKVEGITIDFQIPEDITVYASLLLTEHIYDLINNCVGSVRRRIEADSSIPGKIIITVEREPDPPDWQEQELNKRCRITIWDNGMGVADDLIDQLGKPGISTRKEEGEHGYGLYGAKRYIQAARGIWLYIRSRPSEFFELAFLLDVYDPVIHKNTSGSSQLRPAGQAQRQNR